MEKRKADLDEMKATLLLFDIKGSCPAKRSLFLAKMQDAVLARMNDVM